MTTRALLVLALALPAGFLAAGPDEVPGPRETIAANENRAPAGRLKDGVLIVRLEAREGEWYAEGPEGMARRIAAFGEEGGLLVNPGPLIRVTAGTDVRVNVRNSLASALTVFGLAERRGIAADSFRIEPGATRELRFTAAEPGLHYYAARVEGSESSHDVVPHPVLLRGRYDSQLNGVIVVDPPGERGAARDRIFVISRWGSEDPASVTGIGHENVMVINGLSWPHTERLAVALGDSLHWRWLNLTSLPHPMHLHGFYFRVDARGDGSRDTTYTREQQRLAVTEALRPGQTMAIVWSPDRPGNWIFHCHIATHMAPHMEPDEHGDMRAVSGHGAHAGGSSHAMARLVLGIHVRPNGAGPAAVTAARAARPMRLLIRSLRPDAAGPTRYAYVFGGSAEESDPHALPLPGPTLVLERDQPVAITVVNRTREPAAVHWHGIELESFPDGVPDWSGIGTELLRAIPPGDSLTVRFTPPRAGTFMYHSHFNELQQISSGLYGAIIVKEPGTSHDPETDRILLVSDGGVTINPLRGPFAVPLLNGRAQPDPIELRAGATYRLRIINIRSGFGVAIGLLDGERPVQWRHIAKDGADLPAAQAVMRPARTLLAVGEILDVEYTPLAAGDLTLVFGFPPNVRPPDVPMPAPTPVEVRVR